MKNTRIKKNGKTTSNEDKQHSGDTCCPLPGETLHFSQDRGGAGDEGACQVAPKCTPSHLGQWAEIA